MSNRQQRRAAKNDPKIKKYTESFAMDLTKIFVDHFDKAAKTMEEGKEIDLNLDEQMKAMMSAKGAELGNFIKGFIEDVNETTKENNQQINKQQTRIFINGRT